MDITIKWFEFQTVLANPLILTYSMAYVKGNLQSGIN
jgi:hypothetical protein